MEELTKSIIPTERIENKIYIIRGKKVMFDRDLAELYGVKTRIINQAVKRNSNRFPDDFMFKLNKQELEIWRSQIVISKSDNKGLRYPPYAFTEQGVAMLSSVLNSNRAVLVNIQIIRTFTKIREMISTNDDLRLKIEVMEKNYDEQFKIVFEAIKQLIQPNESPSPEIGFKVGPDPATKSEN